MVGALDGRAWGWGAGGSALSNSLTPRTVLSSLGGVPFLAINAVLAPFHPRWSLLNLRVAPFETNYAVPALIIRYLTE